MNTIVVNLNKPWQRDSIVCLHKKNIINLKLWFGFKAYSGKYKGIDIESSDAIQNKRKPSCAEYCPVDVYDSVYQQIVNFYKVQERWEFSVEPYNMTHKFNMWLDWWYYFLVHEKIEFILFGIIPHSGIDYVLYVLAKKLGIKTVICLNIINTDRFMASCAIEQYGTLDLANGDILNPPIKLKKEFYKNIYYAKDYTKRKVKPITTGIAVPIIPGKLNIKRWVSKLVEFNLQPIYNCLERLCLRQVQNNLGQSYSQKRANYAYSKISDEDKYVYFPLHLQPELATECLGHIYDDQLLAVERLAAILPKDFFIYVKDYPRQSYYKRGNLFWERLRLIDKVKVIAPYVDTYKLMEQAQFVAAISGTAGWEAISGGKNVVVFGYAWYRTLPGVFQYSPEMDINKVIDYRINHQELELAYNKLLGTLFEGYVDNEYLENGSEEDWKINNEKLFNSFVKIIELLDTNKR